ncbi:SDR family oxidoreductase [Corynebacterium sp.]|uniref:SDR family oxidoreductase n=1 Tax=Corynebacterium sp. TaxID=1720 RepID=UPI0026DAB6FA|nr:SDR family oxidoreductase [Corynebacterium sp.]MDO4610608.1 SDR family oxidoreductase [Corynebacterium sp.]
METINGTRTALITGAGRGIGRSVAEKLLSDGWTVGVYDISGDQAWAEGRPNAIVGTLDVTDPDQWESVLADFTAQAGGLDLLLNNAGILYGGAFEDSDHRTDATIVDVNVKGVIHGCRAAFPYLKARVAEGRRPLVINMSSAAAIYGTPDMATYSATKFAVRGITEALEVEWFPHGIAVRSVMPLFTDTGMLDGVSTSGTRRMGVRLTPDDVRDQVLAVVEKNLDQEPTPPTKVHYPAGLQAKVLWVGAHMSPSFLTRFVNGKLTTDRKITL